MKKIFGFLLALFLSIGFFAGLARASCAGEEAALAGAAGNVSARQEAGLCVFGFEEIYGSFPGASVTYAAADCADERGLEVKPGCSYTDKEHVAAYIKSFGRLPGNYITKGEARKLGWQSRGTLDRVAPGKSIGGDRFGNYERLLPEKPGRVWRECDIDYVRGGRNGKRIVYSSDGLIYYTGDHYRSFVRLY